MMTNRLLLSMAKAMALCAFSIICAKAYAQPDDWNVTPSAYEFSMTRTFTVAVNGLVGAGSANAAAIFDANGA